MHKTRFYFPFLDYKYTWHLEAVSQLLHTHTMAFQYPGLKPPYPVLQPKQLGKCTFHQAEL